MVGNYPVQWRVSDGGNGHWYETVRPGAPITWLNARGIAHERGGYLASVTSLSEDDFVWSLASDPQNWNGSPGPWMGGRQLPGASEPASGWTWDSGEVFLWPSWQASPNNLCGGINENSLHYFSPAGVTPQRIWNDLPGEELCGPYPFPKALIVEWSADCNNDGIVDKGQILRGQLQDVNADGVPDVCQQPTCRDADFFPDRNINGVDLGVLLSQWGPPTQYTVADLNRDGVVDGIDLGLFLAFWGPCPY